MATINRPISGRNSEQAVLRRALESDKSEFVALYGRRRVGKTFLVRRFFQSAPVVYFEVVGRYAGGLRDHLRIFAESVSETFHGGAPLEPPASWHDAFLLLRRAIEGQRRRRRRIVVFLDELPWLDTRRSGCLRELEHFWNAWCQRRDDIVLVVCGSAASWMLRKIVQARGGLHDRLTRTIRLLPFTLGETRTYLRDRGLRWTDRQVVELYLSVGGVPHYLDHVERGHSVPQLIDRLYLHKDGALASEFQRLFASLFREDAKYVAVIRALGRRRGGLSRNDLIAATGLPSGGGTSTILTNLVEGGFITMTIPFGRTSRDRLYRLTDELSLFHLGWLDRRRPTSWLHVRGTPRWQAWSGLAFEGLCVKHADAIERALGIAGVATEVSTWSHPEAQVDLVIDRADDVVSLCEVKFTEAPFAITRKYAADLRNKIAVFRHHTGTRKGIQLVFVTSHGLKDNAYCSELVDRVVTMDELFT